MGIISPVTHLALSGGIGGAKLALGLEHIFNSPKLMIAGNTGDDFEHFGLNISPILTPYCIPFQENLTLNVVGDLLMKLGRL